MTAKRTSFGTTPGFKWHSQSAIQLEELDKKDAELLFARSREKTRHLLRKLSYPGEITGDRKPIQYFGKPPPSFVRPPLKLALGPSDPKLRRLVPDVHPEDAQVARRLLIEAQGPLVEDAASLLGRSLGNLDSRRPHKTLLPRLDLQSDSPRMRAKGNPIDYVFIVPEEGPGSDSGISGAKVFVRPSFQMFERVEMLRQDEGGRVKYSTQLMAPHGNHCHLYEVVLGSTSKLVIARDQPSVELVHAPATPDQTEALTALCRAKFFTGSINTLQRIDPSTFQMDDTLGFDGDEAPEIDPWEDDKARTQLLRQCFDADLIHIHMSDFCYAAEEPEVLHTLRELYSRLYETYAMFAGRSQWPMVRQVDVYAFFEEAALLYRDPKGAPSGDSPLALHDIEQIMVQTITHPHNPGPRLRHGRPEQVRHAAMVQQQTREGAPISRPQFIEVMLRAAIYLYGNMPSTSMIFRRFADEIISGRIQQAPLAAFPRGLKLTQGEYIETLQAHRDTLQEARERFGANMNAFQRLAQLLKICDRQFTAKHMASIFACARRPVADFRSKEVHTGLGYDEFCEAISRLALVWQPSKGPSAMPGTKRMWPAQPVCGQPVHQKVLAARLKAFLAKMAERMRPTVRTNPSIF